MERGDMLFFSVVQACANTPTEGYAPPIKANASLASWGCVCLRLTAGVVLVVVPPLQQVFFGEFGIEWAEFEPEFFQI
ncbi:hypothetical protein CFELI_14325 [Corynebacterium felinum]|nr:hypothetical protein CFELI_14325 [Corynebacterium felinum]